MSNIYQYQVASTNDVFGSVNFLAPELKNPKEINYCSKDYRRIIVYQGKMIIPLKIEDILVVFTDNNMRFIQTFEKQFLCTYSLERLEQMFASFFFRINRQYLISYNSIDQIFFEDTTRLCVKLKNPASVVLQVSRRRTNSFITWLEQG